MHRSKTAGVAIAAPPSWIDVTRLSPEVLKRAQQLPDLKAYVALIQRTAAIKLIVVDVGPTSVRTRYATNLNVAQVKTTGGLSRQRQATVAQLKSTRFVSGPIQSGYADLPAGRAVTLAYQARYTKSVPKVAIRQFIFVRGGKATVLTYSTLPKLQAAYAQTFIRSARSFRFS